MYIETSKINYNDYWPGLLLADSKQIWENFFWRKEQVLKFSSLSYMQIRFLESRQHLLDSLFEKIVNSF